MFNNMSWKVSGFVCLRAPDKAILMDDDIYERPFPVHYRYLEQQTTLLQRNNINIVRWVVS